MLKLASIAGLLCYCLTAVHTQDLRPVFLHGSGPVSFEPISDNARSLTAWPQNNCAGGKCYALLQFDAIPDPLLIDDLAELGIQLYDFIPDFAYLASLAGPTTEVALPSGVYGISAISPDNKRSPAPLGWASPVEDDQYRFIVLPFRGLSIQALNQQLQAAGYLSVSLDTLGVYLQIATHEVEALLQQPGVMYVEGVNLPPIAEGMAGRGLLRLGLLNRGPGQGYDGTNVTIGLGDDGHLLHLDFKNRVIDFSGLNNGNHAEMTAGLAIGSGNINPWGMGMAPGARLLLFDIASYEHITLAPQFYNTHRMVITSTSYGEGCGGFYSLTAQQLDQQVTDHPYLLHFFSAGNSGAEACPNIYGGLNTNDDFRYGNITGGRKTSKNSITVGNVHYNDLLRSTSSRGPTSDGRIKPDLCAQGQGSLTTDENNNYRQSSGTSASAPSLAGGAACLYDYYRETHNDQDPSSALIKACLMNSAEDLGDAGPDFSHGWGRANIAAALAILQQGAYQTGSLAAGNLQTHTFTVAPGVKEAKIMLYWHDKAGSPLAAKSLVNDLDLRIIGPGGQVSLPWSPSSFPQVDSLGSPASYRLDRLNNAEQVVLLNPVAGTYTIQIAGYQVPQGPQPYVVVYHFTYDNITLTYPLEGDAVLAAENTVIRWDAYGNQGTFTLDFSVNNGGSWQTIASNIPATQRYYDWTTPATTSAQALVRIRRAAQIAASGGNFSICAAPQFSVQFHATTQCRVSWPAIPGAIGYEVLALGDKYMQVMGSTSTAEWLMPVSLNQTYWISVQALLPGGKKGPRAIAQKYTHQGCEYNMTLVLNFDQYPGETRWMARAADGTILASGGPYISQAPNTQRIENFCLPAGCFDFVLFDTYGDGMCCLNGNGSYALISPTGSVIASGSTFGSAATHGFCTSVTQPLQLSAIQSGSIGCAGGQNGWASVTASGGSGNYTYIWSNGLVGGYVSGLSAGTYSLTVSDGQSSISSSVTISAPSSLSYQLQSLPAHCQNGSLTLSPAGGTGPYQVYWQNGLMGNTLSGLSAGTYAFTVTDANGCTLPALASVEPGPALQLSAYSLSPSCSGFADGFVSVQATGGTAPYTYLWNTGATTPTLANLAANTYSVTVTDSRACSAQASRTLSAPPAISLSIQSTPASPSVGGSAQALVYGGTPPYTYFWNTGATSAQLSGLSAGIYTLLVTDDLGCTANASVNILPTGIPTYCPSTGTSTSFEWIRKVKVNDTEVESGRDGGYGNYTEWVFPLTRGTTALIELTPGYTGQPYNENWRVFIDFNRDGDFNDAGETIVSAGPTNQPVLRSFVPPQNASLGLTRMRVSMQYGTPPSSCGILSYGEVEDYTILIQAQNLQDDPTTDWQPSQPNAGASFVSTERMAPWQLWPNPASGQDIQLRGQTGQLGGHVSFRITNASGQLIQSWQETYEPGTTQYERRLPIHDLPAGIYQLRIQDEQHEHTLRFVRLLN